MFGLLGGVSTVIAGFFTGSGLSVVNKVLDIFSRGYTKKIELQSRKMDYEHELNLQGIEHQFKLDQAETEREVAMVYTDSSNLESSFKHDASYGTPVKWASTVLRFFRPLLTLLLLIMTVWVINRALRFGTLTSAEILLLVDQLFGFTAVAIGWWFGDRSIEKLSARST